MEDAGKRLVLTRAAARNLSRLPEITQDQIRQKLDPYAQDPGSLADTVKALEGEGRRFPLRVGDWRAVFTIEPDRIIVHVVGWRGAIYD